MKMTAEMCQEIFEGLPLNDQRWLILFAQELQSARQKHPTMGKDVVHAAAVVAEEAGELVRAALQVVYEKGKYYRMHSEAIQVGAMALRFCTEGAPELPYPPRPAAKNNVQTPLPK